MRKLWIVIIIAFQLRWKNLIWDRIFGTFCSCNWKSLDVFTGRIFLDLFFSYTCLILEKYTVKLLSLSTTLFAKFRLYDT